MKNANLRSIAALVVCLATMGSAHALTLVSAPFPAAPASTSAFNAVGTFNFGNQKARLSAAGQSDLQGGNPGNGWWGPNTGTGGLRRSWEVIWNNTAGTVTFNVYANNDYTGLAMTMTQTPILAPGNTLVGLDIGANMGGVAGRSFQYTDVQFNDGSGFVSVPGANALYNGVPNTNNYFALSGTLSNFTLRGQAQFLSGSVTSDGMRFFINGRQAVPNNQAPVATDDFYCVDQLGTLVESVPGILGNDTDPDNDTLTVELLSGPSHAADFTQNSNGSFAYTPMIWFFGTDTYTYRVFDGTTYSDPATVVITVRQPGAQGFITGGGKFFHGGKKCTFGFVAKAQGSRVRGNLEFRDHCSDLNLKSQSVAWVYAPNMVDGYFSGTCTLNGLPGYTYFVQVHDRGEPGRNDDFSVWVYGSNSELVYSSTGRLIGGNIQVHRR